MSIIFGKQKEGEVMEIIVAKHGGFCRGVKKAVDTAMSISAENTYIYGEIIHLRLFNNL